MIYIYESHLGGYHASDEPLDYDVLYCEECGDADTLVGEYDPASPGDALRFALDAARDGNYSTDYIKDKTEEFFDRPPDFGTVWETLRKSEEDLHNDT